MPQVSHAVDRMGDTRVLFKRATAVKVAIHVRVGLTVDSLVRETVERTFLRDSTREENMSTVTVGEYLIFNSQLGETGARSYRGRLLQGHFMQNYYIDGEIADSISILIHQGNY